MSDNDALYSLEKVGLRLEHEIYSGKESVIYSGVLGKRDVALKVFQPHKLKRMSHIFKRYEIFQDKTLKNPQKLAEDVAMSEYTFIKKASMGGVSVPTPIARVENVVVMDFITYKDDAAPTLKDIQMNDIEMEECYNQILTNLKNLYKNCDFIHGDLSEYNILLNGQGKVVIIDWSLSLLKKNYYSYDVFLRGIKNIGDFFGKDYVEIMKEVVWYG